MPVMDERGLPTNVIDELNRLVREVEDKANRPPGVRHKRERTDADRQKERERSVRRRKQQTEKQREAERVRSLRRRKQMTPEERKKASQRRVQRRQARKGKELNGKEKEEQEGGEEGDGGDETTLNNDNNSLVAAQLLENVLDQRHEAMRVAEVELGRERFAPPPGQRTTEHEGLMSTISPVINTLTTSLLGVLDGSTAAPLGLTATQSANAALDAQKEHERQRSAFRRDQMTAEEKQWDSQQRHQRRVRSKTEANDIRGGSLDVPGRLDA
tara:strand:+ start:5959 stop:6771 length:813 start_codon:yes stop_codon:yes gene_type:complete